MSKKSGKRPWRKLVKKLHRKHKRQKAAQLRDKEIEKAEEEKLKDPFYKSSLDQQEEIARQQNLKEQTERQEQEELWLRRELLAQKQFKKDEIKRKAVEAELEAERHKQEEELKVKEDAYKIKRDKIKLLAEKTAKEFDDIMLSMKNYLEDITLKTPTRLGISVESRPGDKSCGFFEKTNCCRYDPVCTFNHIRPMLAKIILIKHFFQHPLLEQQKHEEYLMSDSELELNERDLREAYDEFCEDVWPVLEEFGSIVNFRTIRNMHSHLRGHVFVEYTGKRSALKAFIGLQNRYYASKRLNVEFSTIQQWHKGVCGPSLTRKCLKGDKCNFLHLMKNINNKYNQPIDNPERSGRRIAQSTESVMQTPVTSWNYEDNQKNNIPHSRSWRWSESPEIELKTKPNEENCSTKIDVEKEFSNTAERKSRKSSLSSQISSCDSSSHKPRFESSHSTLPKSSRKSSVIETKYCQTNTTQDCKKKEIIISSTQRRKNSRRRSSDSETRYNKSTKKTKHNSPISEKKRSKSSKKTNKSPDKRYNKSSKYSTQNSPISPKKRKKDNKKSDQSPHR